MPEENKTSVSFPNLEQVEANNRQEEGKQTPAVDLEALAKMFEERLDKKLDEFGRKQQGLRKKQEERIRQTVNDLLAAQRAAGVEMTKEQTQLLESHVRQQVEAEEVKAEEPPAPQKADKADPMQEYVANGIKEIFDEFGVVYTNDPEAEGLDKISDPVKFLLELRKRAEKKAQRLKVPAEARTPTMSTSGQAGNMESEYKKEMLANRGKGYKVGEEIKEKYRKLGVKVDEISLFR
jgi:hypothetical protein